MTLCLPPCLSALLAWRNLFYTRMDPFEVQGLGWGVPMGTTTAFKSQSTTDWGELSLETTTHAKIQIIPYSISLCTFINLLGWHHVHITDAMWFHLSGDMCHSDLAQLNAKNVENICHMPLGPYYHIMWTSSWAIKIIPCVIQYKDKNGFRSFFFK